MDKLITSIQGGKHLTMDDLGALQTFQTEALKNLLIGLGLGQQTFILSGCQLSVSGGNISVTQGALSFSGEVCICPAQSVTGTNLNNCWFQLYTETGHPRPFFSGLSHNTHEYRKIRLVYANTSPSNSVSAVVVVTWSKYLYDNVIAGNIPKRLQDLTERSYNSLTDKPTIPTVITRLQDLTEKSYNSLTDKPTIPTVISRLQDMTEKSYNSLTDKPTIPTKLHDLTERSYNSLTDKPVIMQDLSTPWTKVTFLSTKFVHFVISSDRYKYDGLQYRKNKMGNVELRGTFVIKPTPTWSGNDYLFVLPDGFRPTYNQSLPIYYVNGSLGSSWKFGEISIIGGFTATVNQSSDDQNVEIGSTIFI